MEIVQAGAAVLRRVAQPVDPAAIGTPELAALVAALWKGLEEVPGVGLAAPQLGVPLRVIVVQDPEEYLDRVPEERRDEVERSPIAPYALINPEIEPVGDERRTFFEGCLSVEGYCGLVERAHTVRVRWLDLSGERHDARCRGWHARILQHEVDHLDGILYVDRMLTRSFMTTANFVDWVYEPVAAVRDAFGI